MRYLIVMALLFLAATKVVGQQQNDIQFNSFNAVGFVSGKSPVAFTVQMVNGIKLNNWFAGAGVGIDNYFINTLPVFLDLKRDIFLRHANLFLFADIGTHLLIKDKKVETGFTVITRKGRLYLDAGIGCKFRAGKKSHIFLSVGNTIKNITQTEQFDDIGFPGGNETIYQLSRISFKAGFQF